MFFTKKTVKEKDKKIAADEAEASIGPTPDVGCAICQLWMALSFERHWKKEHYFKIFLLGRFCLDSILSRWTYLCLCGTVIIFVSAVGTQFLHNTEGTSNRKSFFSFILFLPEMTVVWIVDSFFMSV
ncbi:hypothetical protein CDAR_535441 [Caerostris darwini]|uniref:Uncharacterized protein n=1 Tax=Caerostris darwini TaxID=1538125 RepID=A0AAV4V1Y8_9ARAC|nr:hypothetical protein CDAR_535441 [Caerostris darwini]